MVGGALILSRNPLSTLTLQSVNKRGLDESGVSKAKVAKVDYHCSDCRTVFKSVRTR